jgi:predicted Zn-dependent peptidase
MWDPYAEFESEMLPNGLTVHATYWPDRPWEAIGFLIHSGAEHDPLTLEGLAHFVEHEVSGNTILPKKNINGFFRDAGGRVSLGTTGYPYTQYGFFVPKDEVVFAKAFSIFGHMLLSAKLEKFIERERQVIVGEFRRHYVLKFRHDLHVRKNRTLYSGYWLERFVRPLGDPDSVGRITEMDLQSYYDRHYTPANMSIVCVGGMTLSRLVKILSESPFAIHKEGSRTSLPDPVTSVTAPQETRHVFGMSEYVTTPIETAEYRSVAKVPGNINFQALRILREMLNEMLNEEVREHRAWTYSIGCSLHNFRHFYEFSIICDAFALDALGEIEGVVESCVASMATREDLFNQFKRRILTGNFMIDPNGRGVCDGALTDLADNQRIISLTEWSDDIEKVTMSDIHNLLQWFRPEQRWTLIIQP